MVILISSPVGPVEVGVAVVLDYLLEGVRVAAVGEPLPSCLGHCRGSLRTDVHWCYLSVDC